ncbi:MAG: hypothetical protein K2X01_08590 [Cyanobacteria bacterium]|nr:hypothetical protein [Cyanobacteriota bacterium]
MTQQRPFEVSRWDAPKEPTVEFLIRWLEREGFHPKQQEHPAHSHSPELKFPMPLVRVVVSGHVQYSFPGYGVVELNPGDRLDLDANILHNVTVTSSTPAVTLNAVPEAEPPEY